MSSARWPRQSVTCRLLLGCPPVLIHPGNRPWPLCSLGGGSVLQWAANLAEGIAALAEGGARARFPPAWFGDVAAAGRQRASAVTTWYRRADRRAGYRVGNGNTCRRMTRDAAKRTSWGISTWRCSRRPAAARSGSYTTRTCRGRTAGSSSCREHAASSSSGRSVCTSKAGARRTPGKRWTSRRNMGIHCANPT